MDRRLIFPMCLATGVSCGAVLVAHGAPPVEPPRRLAANEPASNAEVEFWRSAERIGSAEAYRAYLAAFPNGLFAPLAHAALGREASPAATAAPAPALAPTSGPPPATPAATVGTGSSEGSASLRHFSEPPDGTGAIAINIGDRFTGPGTLTLGWLGAKKQLVLPEGEWVALAAVDSASPLQLDTLRSRYTATLTTVTFGKFAGARLVALMRFTSNTRPARVPSWTDIDGCGRGGPSRLQHERTRPNSFRDECLAIRVAGNPMIEDWPGREQTRQSLSKLGASTRGTALVTTLTMGELRWGYLGVTRVDWPGPALGAESEPPAGWRADGIGASSSRKAYLDTLANWASGYRKVASEGYRSGFEGPDLSAGSAARGTSASGPGVKDFDPGRTAQAR